MTKITFYKGLKEIGGTFVCVETDSTRCMFDYGFAVNDRVDSKILKRQDSYVEDCINLGMLNGVDGIFDRKTAAKTGLKPYEERDKECFFVISHMHIDHMGGLGCLHPDLPVYMSEESVLLYSELAHNNEVEHAVHCKCYSIPAYDTVTVGDITVKCVPIDHDVIGACGFIISTADGDVTYTGDYRLHGFHPEVTRRFAEECKNTDVLITEGVTVSFEDIDILSLTEPEEAPKTEYDLLSEVAEYAKNNDGLIVVNPYARNVERIHALINTFADCGRTLLLDKKSASYVHAFYPADEIKIYEPLLSYQKDNEEFASIDDSLGFDTVSREEVISNPAKYALQLDYFYMFELIELKGIASKYIHMDGVPLGDYDPSYAKLKQLLAFLNIEYVFASLGGHAKPYYLRTVIDQIAPKNLIPLHSFRPWQVDSKMAGKRILPEFMDSYELKNGQLIKIEL